MKPFCFLAFVFLSALPCGAQNNLPVFSNVTALADTVGHVMRIWYDLSDAENEDCEVWIRVRSNDTSYTADVSTAMGDMGFPVSPGTEKQVIWPYGPGHPDVLNYDVQLVADDRYAIDIQQIVDQVDTMNLRNDLSWVQGIRDPAVDPAHWLAVRDSMKTIFDSLGLETELQAFQYNGIDAHNVIGRLKGCADAGKTYIVDAHFDTYQTAPGADDNGSGVVGVWEVARIMSQYTFRNNIRFIGFDLEEAGLIGSNRYVLQGGIKNWETIGAALNFEMIGYYSDADSSQHLPAGFNLLFPAAYDSVAEAGWKGNFLTNVGNTNSGWLKTMYDSVARIYVPDLRVISVEVPGTGTLVPDLRRSDHASFWDAQIPALMLTDAANFRNPNYHTPNDIMDSLNFGFMGKNVKATLAVLCELAGLIHCSSYAFTASADPASGFAKEKQHPSVLSLSPNPATGKTRLAWPYGWEGETHMLVFNAAGKVVRKEVVPAGVSHRDIKIKGWPVGTYHIVLISSTEVGTTRLLVSE